MDKLKESDLFGPIRSYFAEDGFIGDGEVGGIDLYLEKDGLSTAVELKKSLDYKAIRQAALDQKTCDLVYIGIFRPGNLFSREMKEKIYLLRRLGIGLLCVSPKTGKVEAVTDPVVSELPSFQRNHRSRTASLKKELRTRRLKNNTGGVSRTKVMTAYREESLLILSALRTLGGESSCRKIRELTGDRKSTGILYNNYYGWFENVSKGVYRLTDEGRHALTEYEEIIGRLQAEKTDP